MCVGLCVCVGGACRAAIILRSPAIRAQEGLPDDRQLLDVFWRVPKDLFVGTEKRIRLSTPRSVSAPACRVGGLQVGPLVAARRRRGHDQGRP